MDWKKRMADFGEKQKKKKVENEKWWRTWTEETKQNAEERNEARVSEMFQILPYPLTLQSIRAVISLLVTDGLV